MIKRTLDEQFKLQTDRHKTDHQNDFGVPVAYIHRTDRSFDENFKFFERSIKNYGGTISCLEGYSKNQAVVISYENGFKEVWVHPREQDYAKIYNKFIEIYEEAILEMNYKKAGYAIDHSYNKASIPEGVDGHLRLFLVKSSANSSWGGYFERKIADLFRTIDKSGIRKETVAIRAKITGINAPQKGNLAKRNLQNIADVVSTLIESGMTHPTQYKCDLQTLAAFCGMADGEYISMTVELDGSGEVIVIPTLRDADSQ